MRILLHLPWIDLSQQLFDQYHPEIADISDNLAYRIAHLTLRTAYTDPSAIWDLQDLIPDQLMMQAELYQAKLGRVDLISRIHDSAHNGLGVLIDRVVDLTHDHIIQVYQSHQLYSHLTPTVLSQEDSSYWLTPHQSCRCNDCRHLALERGCP